MFLHEDKELFRDVIEATAEELKRPAAIVEKDYYVTMILKLLSEKAPECVFKGGTSLSKCHHAIERFSEDIDIAFSNELTQGQRKHLKNEIIAGISQSLGLPISDWDRTRSRRDYNCYTFDYIFADDFCYQFLLHNEEKAGGMSDADYSDCRKCSPWLYADYRCHHSAHLKHCPGL